MNGTAASVSDVRELDAARALSYVAACRRNADREEANLLAAVVHWVDLHPVTDQEPAASSRSRTRFVTPEGACEPPLAGVGTPGIAEFAVEELAGTLGVSYHTGLHLVSEAVELCYRLPRLWALVQSGKLQAWKARQVARETTHLSRTAVDFVDRHAATTGHRNQIPPLRGLIHEALLRCDPQQAADVEQAALEARGVWFDHRESTATTDVTARMDTVDALDLDDAISDLACIMGRLGDDRPLDIRRSTALGMLAQPQRALDLADAVASGAPPPDVRASEHPGLGSSTPGPDGRLPDALNRSRAVLYLHVTTADLAAWATASADPGCAVAAAGSVERLGTASLQLLREWLQRASGVTVRPVLDLDRSDAVDHHDGPDWMREIVMLRDKTCVFPGCTVDARRCDLDHIEAYVPLDDGGPPGQTCVENLACLCRRHHRLKTFTAWTYRRANDGHYVWTSPRGRTLRSRPG